MAIRPPIIMVLVWSRILKVSHDVHQVIMLLNMDSGWVLIAASADFGTYHADWACMTFGIRAKIGELV
jgi:hypothetical protein